jgi:aspartyl-tRNA(Asn)/glutamyl-tRNA(Gln) amidotransferase subunit C
MYHPLMPSPSVSREEVLRIARLTRLRLPGARAAAMRADLDRIIGFVDRLAALDLAETAPEADVPPGPPLRTDTVRPGLSESAALAAAPAQERGHVLVPRVIAR